MFTFFLWPIVNELNKIYKVLRLRKPGLVFIRLKYGEKGMLKFSLVLPEKSAQDVVSREVVLSLNGGEPMNMVLEGNASETQEMDGNDGDSVVGSLVDTDYSGNRSEAREFSFILKDTFAPPMPGEVGIRVREE